MTPQEFVQGIKRLSNYYLKFELNKEQAEAWYTKFKNVEYSHFVAACSRYTDKEVFAPQSPASLLQYLPNNTMHQISGEEAASFVNSLPFGMMEGGKAKKAMLAKDPVIWETFKGVVGADGTAWHHFKTFGVNNFNTTFRDTYNMLKKRDKGNAETQFLIDRGILRISGGER